MADTKENQSTESFGFKAEIQQLLHILAHSLYKDRDIFLRELISNASDALTRMHFESLTNRDVLDADAPLAIHIDVVETAEGQPRQIVIKDSGIGMTHDEIVRNLGTIAQSGAREFMEKLNEGQMDPNDVIGQFGVGFYSVFMVAQRARVISRSHQREAEAVVWSSDGSDRFQVEPAEKADRGTEITITLKPDAAEFADNWKLQQTVRKYSDYVRYPIYVGETQANQQQSLWRRPAAEISAEEYQRFYQQMTMDFEEPLLTVHFASDAPVQVRALLFVPARREAGPLQLRREPGPMLYSHNVLIQEYSKELLPSWLGFVDGVVDSEDLPLNVSRETVQNNRLMQQLGKTIRNRILRELKKLAESDAGRYARFWEEYKVILKEGAVVEPAAREEILPLFRYQSTRSDGQLTSLDEVIGRMVDTQEELYYIIGDSLAAVINSPHLDAFKARELEVLYWTDPLDVLLATSLSEYKGKKLRNVDSAGLELPEVEVAEEEAAEDEGGLIPEADFNRFVGRCVTTLGNRVVEVRASKVLKDSPVRLVSPKDAPQQEIQRIYRMMGREYEVPQKIFEINRRHPLIADLARLATQHPESEFIPLSIEQLYASALLQEGLHPNPVEMLPRIQQLMSVAAEALTEK
jgi:molecular chaperone HtpG